MAKKNQEVQPSVEDLMAQIQALQAKNAELQAANDRGLTVKVSKKGGVSVYGLQRFPLTLYREQWSRLLDCSDSLKSFLETHSDMLGTKDNPVAKEYDESVIAKTKTRLVAADNTTGNDANS